MYPPGSCHGFGHSQANSLLMLAFRPSACRFPRALANKKARAPFATQRQYQKRAARAIAAVGGRSKRISMDFEVSCRQNPPLAG